jgi:uncharacterized protein (DUF58 family)
VFGKTRITICREGLYYLVVLSFIVAGAIMREINLLVIIAGMMLAPLLINLRLAIATLHRLKVERRLPATICAGEPLLVEILATNARRWFASWAVVVEDRVEGEARPDGRDHHRVEVFLPQVLPGQTQSVCYRGRLNTRGRYRFGPLRVSTRFPLGLIRRTVIVDAPDELTVCPRIGRLHNAWSSELRAEQAGAATSQSRQGLLEGDFYGLRDWRAGDSRRLIHWRTSARRGALAVREFERQHERKLTILLDLWLPDDPTPEQQDNLELAISFGATAVVEQCRRGGSRVWFASAGREATVFDGASSMALMQEVMTHLALVQSSAATPVAELLVRGLRHCGSGGRLVLVSTRPVDHGLHADFADLREDPQAQHALRQCLIIDAGSETLGKYFDIE